MVARRGASRRTPPWGDGFVDEAPDVALATVSWREVASDELVLRLPGLPHPRPLPPEAVERLRPLLAEALARRSGGLPADHPGAGAYAIHCIRRGLDALDSTAPPAPAADILEAVCLSFEAGFNASYLRPETELLQEILTAAAWLGVVARGRDALLPQFVAEVIQRLPAAPGTPQADPFSLASAFLGFRVRQAGLERTLRKAATDARLFAAIPLVKAVPRPARETPLPPLLAAAMEGALRSARLADQAAASRNTA